MRIHDSREYRRLCKEGSFQYDIFTFTYFNIPAPSIDALAAISKRNIEIQSAFIKHYNKIASGEYEHITVSVSGGADSDRVVDFVERIGYGPGTVDYIFFDTGMEFKATKDHLTELENKYDIKIKRIHAKMPVAIACKKYGVPFLSKQISEYIMRLQKHGFKWEDRPFEELYAEYPKCKSALRWWCTKFGEKSKCNISNRKWLKEFLVANPPDFPISAKCCEKSKKATSQKFNSEHKVDLSVQGVRKAEGGERSIAIKSCFTEISFGCSVLRPLFWFKKSDCAEYDYIFGIEHSLCYSKYGLLRTGCACCPFGRYFEDELEAAEMYEPALYRLANMVFAK